LLLKNESPDANGRTGQQGQNQRAQGERDREGEERVRETNSCTFYPIQYKELIIIMVNYTAYELR